jgi:hypothetical protein
MSNNLTEKLNSSLEDKVDRVIGALQLIDSRLVNLETKVDQRSGTQPSGKA